MAILSEDAAVSEVRGCDNMRFKIGDMVSVRSDIDMFRRVDGILILRSMRNEREKIGRIIGAVDEGKCGFYKINSSVFWWPGAMLREVEGND